METNKNETSKEDYIKAYIKQFAAIEEAMEPFKDQRRDLRENYNDNGWLSEEEMRLAVKAYRLLKSDTDMDQLTDYFNRLKRTVGAINV